MIKGMLMEFSSTLDMTIPFWGILCALVAGAYFIVNMNFKITMLEKEIHEQKKTLSEIKALVYEILKPHEHFKK
jgi:cell division protein FtsL